MTATYTLQRVEDDGKETTGSLEDPQGNFLAYTIERPWLNNAQDVSCVPPETYLFYSYLSPHNGAVWRTDQVPGRTAIEIHAGNTVSDVDGCICVGNAAGELLGQDAVLNSKETMEYLHSKLPDRFYLNIIGIAQ